MTDTKWHMEGRWLEYCSCSAGCPCESMEQPSEGTCDGVVAMQIDEGYFGDIRLDGITIAATFYFPRAIHHGGGHMQAILPDSTSPEQRDAVFTILGGEGQPVGTIFNIFSVIVEHHHEPIFTAIEFDWDIDKRRARLSVPGIVEASTLPIRNPVTDEEVQVRTVLPSGWVFYEAEVGNGTMKSISDIKFDHAKRHSSLAHFAFNNGGMAYTYEEAKARYGLDGAA